MGFWSHFPYFNAPTPFYLIFFCCHLLFVTIINLSDSSPCRDTLTSWLWENRSVFISLRISPECLKMCTYYLLRKIISACAHEVHYLFLHISILFPGKDRVMNDGQWLVMVETKRCLLVPLRYHQLPIILWQFSTSGWYLKPSLREFSTWRQFIQRTTDQDHLDRKRTTHSYPLMWTSLMVTQPPRKVFSRP